MIRITGNIFQLISDDRLSIVYFPFNAIPGGHIIIFHLQDKIFRMIGLQDRLMVKYIGYWRRHNQYEHEQPTIGLIICREAGREEVVCALEGLEDMKHANNFNTVFNRLVKKHIIADGNTTNPRSTLIASFTDNRSLLHKFTPDRFHAVPVDADVGLAQPGG